MTDFRKEPCRIVDLQSIFATQKNILRTICFWFAAEAKVENGEEKAEAPWS